ncbi:uncharacterized protein LOC128550634 [Mercenaria mercenaria]|uniref:uncharacterized protein LOC128550634 n=1 Tax=Mercenaria mercenaria TaxID=6596 RepID=UPI00234EE923|nr:uncharacterized protein LOC128550634 [Mercenaria mercenaria]
MTKDDLCYLRTVVANILLIPSSFVLIDGVDPSSSITVTMLIPDQHVEILQKMLNAKDIDLSELIAFGVDSFTIGESVFPVAENSKISTDTYMEQSDVEMIVKLQKSRDTVANLELENMKQMERIKEVETQNLLLQAQNETFMRSAKPNHMFPEGKIKLEKPDELDTEIQDALLKFSNYLEEMSKDNCNKQLVLQLLKAHATLIATRCFQELSMMISKVAVQAQNLTILKGTHVALRHFFESEAGEPTPIKIVKEISQKLLPEEKSILEKDYNWTEHDKEAFQKSSLPFLLSLMAKESTEKGDKACRNLTEFLRRCLTKIIRIDLLLEFLEKVANYGEEDIEDAASSSTTASDIEVQASRVTKMEEMSKNVKKILDKLNSLDDKMHSVPELGNIARQIKGEYPFWLYKLLCAE